MNDTSDPKPTKQPGQSSEPAEASNSGPAASFEAGRDISAGRDVAGRDIAGRDIAGRDVVTQTVYVGLPPQTVLRLVIVVGAIVFLTAACFFSGGVALTIGAINALGRPVNSTAEAAASMENKLAQVQALPPGREAILVFTEQEISSYFRHIAGPRMGIQDGRVRLVKPGELIIAGRSQAQGNLQFAATFELQNRPGETFKLTGAAVRFFGSPDNAFGWVAVPTGLLKSFAQQINQTLGSAFRVTGVAGASNQPPAWAIEIVTGQSWQP